MIVAWQFTAWNRLEKAFRPVRVRCDTGPTFVRTCRRPHVIGDRIIPSLRDGLFFGVVQAANCLATITRSLRDKTSLAPVRKIDSTPTQTLEHEDEDETPYTPLA
jgi:hypothetical protein